MIAATIKKNLLLVILLVGLSMQSGAQQRCVNKFSSIRLHGTTYDSFTVSTVTANNEIIVAGGLSDYNEAGHVAKLSEKGSPIWSYIYNLDYYNFTTATFFKKVNFSDIITTPDGGYLVAGNVEQVLSPFGSPPPVKKWGLMAKLDRFGKVLWTKSPFTFGELSFTNVLLAANGDYIAYLAADNGPKHLPGDHSYGRVLRIAPDGTIRWTTFLFTYLFDAGGLGLKNKRGVIQAANSNIIIGDVVHKTSEYGIIQEGNLHFLELDFATGKVNWETSYEYPAPSNDTVYLPDIVNAKPLSDGRLSFITSLYLPSPRNNSLEKKAVNIITSSRGVMDRIYTYVSPGNNTSRISGAVVDKNNGNRTLLFDNDGKIILANINDDGEIMWQHGYNNGSGNFPANCFSTGNSGYNIFTSNNRSKEYRLVITDETGVIDCENEISNIIMQPAVLNYSHDNVVTNPEIHLDNVFDDHHPLKRNEEYTLEKSVTCQDIEACCTDMIDRVNVNDVHICEGRSYMLPDNTVIQDSGLYDITFKTALGCDSVRYYKVSLDKDVRLLNIGNDTCLTNNAAILLKATGGFEKYYWMNSSLPTDANFTVSQTGSYFASVYNACGSKTDSVEIFDLCDYPVHMPNVFTPNGDHINDIFRIPLDNKNKLNGLKIYNRWGKLIFQTSNPSAGWDGTYLNEPLGTDTFIYFVEMTGLSGRRVTKKGYVTLIR